MEYFILLLIVYFITLFMVYKLVSRSLDIKLQKNKIESDKLIKDTEIDNKVLDQLDSIINDILEEYVVFEIKTKDVTYINNNIEDKIRAYITEEITKRISVLLMKKLEYVYNSDYIGELIGKRIYMSVTDYSLKFNVENDPLQNNKNAR